MNNSEGLENRHPVAPPTPLPPANGGRERDKQGVGVSGMVVSYVPYGDLLQITGTQYLMN